MFVQQEQDGWVGRVLVGPPYSRLFDQHQGDPGGEDEEVPAEGL